MEHLDEAARQPELFPRVVRSVRQQPKPVCEAITLPEIWQNDGRKRVVTQFEMA